MIDCCDYSYENYKNAKKCVRKKDKKTFKVPRKFNRDKCNHPKGFTMRSSCAPFKYCNQTGGKSLSFKKNINNETIQVCSLDPKTGYYRDGYCMTGDEDKGTHTVCAEMDKSFLDFTKSNGNDLSSVVVPGDRWCLCENRWNDSFINGTAPRVIENATNMRTNDDIIQNIRKHSSKKGGGRKKQKTLPKLRLINYKNKKHKYKLKDPKYKRIQAINEGIKQESNNKSIKDAATSKKARFNVLRIYRKNKYPEQCNILTNDMKYIDKKYKLGKTKNICRKTQKGGKTNKKQFLYNPNNPEKSFDVYIDKNPKDTIPIKYTTVKDVKHTIKKLERLYKYGKYSHKRIWQVGMIMYVRLKVLKKKKPKQFKLSERYFKHLGKRTQINGEKERKKYFFRF